MNENTIKIITGIAENLGWTANHDKENNTWEFSIYAPKITSEIIEKLFGAACMGDTETLKTYYKNGGKPNLRYIAFGKMHSLLQGAYNNGQWKTVDFLLQHEETLTEAEQEIMTAEYMRIRYMEKIIMGKHDIMEDINTALDKAYPNMTEV